MKHRLFSFGWESFFLIVLLALLSVFSPSAPWRSQAAGSIIFAAPSAVGSGNCSSWANACTLQTALGTAVSGDEIWVKAGVHYPGSAGNRDASFQLRNGVAVYGGFAGTESSRDQRDWQTNKTILSGDIDHNDNHGGDYINDATSQIVGSNAYHVVSAALIDSSAVLDGFIITAGKANGATYDSLGGGIFNQFSSPSLANLTFSGNAATYGGGMYNHYSDPTLNTVTLHGNSATADGGGMLNYHSSPHLNAVTLDNNSAPSGNGGGMTNDHSSNPTLTNVTFNTNTATNGAGMYNRLSSPSLIQVTFSTNEAYDSGGGMANQSSSPQLTNVTFSTNYAYAYGGGMLNRSSSPQLTNVSFTSNGVEGCGGGMANLDASHPQLINGVFRSNTGFSCGGGLFNDSSNPTLVNVTFNGNVVYNDSGGGIYNDNSSPTLTNVILWGDSAPSAAEISNTGSSAPLISYSDIQGGYAGTGNINADPLFDGNLRLQLTSPAIDAGDNAALPSGIMFDLNDNPRYSDVPAISDTGSGTPPIVDMGAYEAFPVLYTAPSAQGNGKCYAWEHACTLKTALNVAINGQEIWVKAGVHYPGSAINDTFTLKNGVAVYGGFNGTEATRSQRNWQTNKTILSGDIDRNDTNTDDNFIAETTTDIVGSNAYHVVTSSGTNSTTVLDGFIITAGNAQGTYPESRGGGMKNNGGSPTLTNVIFSGNMAKSGGGMDNNGGSPTLTNVIFSGNQANLTSGGGMVSYYGNPMLTDVTFSSNSAHLGGGMSTVSGAPILNHVIFNSNHVSTTGGGMYNERNSPSLTNVTFIHNSAKAGGGMYNESSSPILTNVTFSGNTANNYGGGMYNDWRSSPTLTNVTFSGNSTTSGGGMYNFYDSNPTLTNVILWGNTATNAPGIYNNSSTPTIAYSDIQDCIVSGSWNSACGNDGGGNIDADPRFVDAANGNLRLGFGSPAIDAGTNSGCPATDIDGLPRPADGNGDSTSTCDMGAYEAGTMICGIAQGNTYAFPHQSGVSIEVTTSGNLGCLYVDEMELNHPNATTGIQSGRYWLIRGLQSDKSTPATGFTVNLTLPTTFTPDGNDKVCRYSGSGTLWDCASSSFTTDSITRQGVTALSDWAVGNNVGPTAVKLKEIHARPVLDKRGLLMWFVLLIIWKGWFSFQNRRLE